MSATTHVTCDGPDCKKLRPSNSSHISWETGWLALTTQFSGEMGDTRRDFCSDDCLASFITSRIIRTAPSGRLRIHDLDATAPTGSAGPVVGIV